jgi:RNA polymerase sigma-70 factor (ECF subfamily)
LATNEPDIHQQLIEKCREGDTKSQYRLYKLYSKAMYNIAIRLLANRMDAEDVLQEAFVAAFRKIGDFRGESGFGAWLKRIVINHCINFLKSKKACFVDLDSQHQDFPDGNGENDDDRFEPEIIHEMIKSLPDGSRIVLNLFLLEDYKHREIAQLLGISESTSKSQYQRAKMLLQEKLMMYEKQL